VVANTMTANNAAAAVVTSGIVFMDIALQGARRASRVGLDAEALNRPISYKGSLRSLDFSGSSKSKKSRGLYGILPMLG
jgi:hypothetical protein